ncbi:MAG TPA: 3' terminal RNA ribose 2'-O-methyltransferase Hen1 [Ktedonobacteraceae bacterium]|nr:3' terminal RNA ribose 2'-O-methyltransferase Hen1 [Ktedonobacteraceae bacterium]
MLFTITTTYQPATDLGYLLHKNPARVQSFALSFGQAHVFYPEASNERCTAALLLDIDPVQLVRGPRDAASLEEYVNDRPYVASSFLSVAIAQVFGTALNGHSTGHQELAEKKLPLQAKLAVLPCRGGEKLLKRLFEPLGYTVTAATYMLDETYPEWGTSFYYTVTLEANCRLSNLLTHLYVLVPVLDDDKHYWIGDDEVEKLLRRGKGWLETHPEREQIAYRYLKHKRSLTRDAIARLTAEDTPNQDMVAESANVEEERIEERLSLHEQRLDAVMAILRQVGARRVLDLGCGEGKLLKMLLRDKSFEKIVGMDVSYRALEMAQHRLNLDHLPAKQKERITLIHGALTYRDKRLEGYDAAAVVEVIEHLDPPRLAAFERVLFEFARPTTVVITTPNAEYNVKFETLPTGKFRHKDHRFEWTRQEFQAWASKVAERFGYAVRFLPVGPEDAVVGAPSQMGIFSRNLE